jgi:hypothetical protein
MDYEAEFKMVDAFLHRKYFFLYRNSLYDCDRRHKIIAFDSFSSNQKTELYLLIFAQRKYYIFVHIQKSSLNFKIT